MKNYKETELPAREGVKEALKRNQEICRRRDELYHQQNDLKALKILFDVDYEEFFKD